jgi:hypothetical protein
VCVTSFRPLLLVTAKTCGIYRAHRVEEARISLADSNKAEIVGLRKSLMEEDRRFQQLHQEAAAHREERKVRAYLLHSIAHIVNTWAAGCSLHEQVRQARSVGSQQADKGEQEAAAARGSVHGEGALKAATSKGRKGHKHQGRKSRQ